MAEVKLSDDKKQKRIVAILKEEAKELEGCNLDEDGKVVTKEADAKKTEEDDEEDEEDESASETFESDEQSEEELAECKDISEKLQKKLKQSTDDKDEKSASSQYMQILRYQAQKLKNCKLNEDGTIKTEEEVEDEDDGVEKAAEEDSEEQEEDSDEASDEDEDEDDDEDDLEDDNFVIPETCEEISEKLQFMLARVEEDDEKLNRYIELLFFEAKQMDDCDIGFTGKI